MSALDIGWQGIGVVATAGLGIYNAVRAHIDRRWVREEPTRAAQREIRTELRERYQVILDEVKAIDAATRAGEPLPAEMPSIANGDADLKRLAARIVPLHESQAIMIDATVVGGLHNRVRAVEWAQGRVDFAHEIEDHTLQSTAREQKIASVASVREDLPMIRKMLTERIKYLTDVLDKGKTDRPIWMGWEQ